MVHDKKMIWPGAANKRTSWSGRTVLAGVIAVVLGASSLFAQAAPSPALSDDNKRIDALLSARDFKGAISFIQQIGSEGRATKITYLRLANIYLETGAGIAAETAVDRAKALGATYGETAVPYAKSFLVQGKYARAIDILSGAEVIDGQQSDALIIMGDANFAEGRFEAARRIYEQARERFPDQFPAYLGLARLDLRDGNLSRAGEYLSLAEVRAPRNTMVQYTSGLIKKYQGDLPSAEVYFLKAVELFPGNLLANIELANLNISRAEFDIAENFLDKVYEGSPDHPVALYMSAVIEAQKGDYKAADSLLGRTRRLTERFLPAMYLRGLVSYALNDFSQAIYILERGVTALPNGVEMRTLLAAAYLREERYSDAFAMIEPIVASKDRQQSHLVIAGAALTGMGQSERARQYFDNARSGGDDGNEDIGEQINLNSILSSYILEQNQQSINDFEQVVSNKAADIQNLGILASMQMRASEFDSARETIGKIIEIAPERAFGHNMLGTLSFRLRDFAVAVEAFNRALALNSNYGAALKNRALASMALLNYDAVEADLRRFISNNPSDMQAQAILAKALLEQNNDEKLDTALLLFAAVSEAFPKDIDLAVDYARALDRRGEGQRAISILRNIARQSSQIEKFDALGEQLMAMGAYAPAAGIVSKYRVAGVDPLRANILYGRILLQSGLKAGALSAFEQAKALSTDSNQSQQLAWYLFAAKVDQLSKEELSSALEGLDENALPSDLSLALIGQAHERQGDIDAAIAAYIDATNVTTQNQDLNVTLSLVKAYRSRGNSGDTERATAVLEGYIETFPTELSARTVFVDLLLEDERFGQAIPHLELLIRSGNTSALTLAKIAKAYYETGTGDAVLFSDRARLIAPNDAFVLDTYGWILLQTVRDIDGALAAFERAISSQPENAEIRYHKAMALLASGDTAAAITELEFALKSAARFHGRIEAERQLSLLKK